MSARFVTLGLWLACAAGPALGGSSARLDRHGDPLPPGARARLGSLRFRTSGSPVVSGDMLHVSPDGKLLALNDLWGEVRLCDAASGRELWRPRTDPRGNRFGCFSPDGRLLATGSADGGIDLWEVATRKRRLRLPGHKPPSAAPVERDPLGALSMAFSPDGKSLASWGCDRTLRRWDVSTGKDLRAWRLKSQETRWFVFSPGGQALAGEGDDDHTLRLWDANTGKVISTLPRQDGRAIHWRWSPDARRLALVTEKGDLHLFAADRGRELWKARPRGRGRHWDAVCFFPDGQVFAADEQGLCVWEAATGREVRVLPGVAAGAAELALCPGGKTLAEYGGGVVRFWDLTTGKERALPEGHTGEVRGLAFSADGKVLASLGSEATVRLWAAADGKSLRVLRAPASFRGRSLVVSADGKGVVAWEGHDYSAPQWDGATGRLLRRFGVTFGGGGEYVAFAYAPDGKTLAATGAYLSGRYYKEAVRLHDTATGKVLRALPVESSATGLTFFPDGKTLAVGEWPYEISGRTFHVTLWDTESGRRLRAFPPRLKGWGGMALSPDGKHLAIYGADALTLWEVATGDRVGTFDLPRKGGVSSVVFTPRGDLLALSRDEQEESGPADVVWDVPAGKRRFRVAGSGSDGACAALAPDGRTLATGSHNGTILLWDVPDRRRAVEGRLGKVEEERLWAELAGADAAAAFRAIRALTASPRQGVALLAGRLRPVPPGRAARLVAELDSDSFAARQAASAALARLGAEAEPALKAVLEGKPSAEARRRARELLRSLAAGPRRPTAEELRALRAVQALEQIGTPEARRLLEGLARGEAEARLSREATAALGRLAR